MNLANPESLPDLRTTEEHEEENPLPRGCIASNYMLAILFLILRSIRSRR